MSDSDFESAFGTPRTASFAERLGRTDAKQTNGEEQKSEPDLDGYKAFGYLPTNTVGETCDVRWWLAGTRISEGIEFQYRFLFQLAYSAEEEIRLFLPDSMVLIRGKHLAGMRKKLARRQVTFIQQYSKLMWPQLPEDGQAVVESIQVVRPEP